MKLFRNNRHTILAKLLLQPSRYHHKKNSSFFIRFNLTQFSLFEKFTSFIPLKKTSPSLFLDRKESSIKVYDFPFYTSTLSLFSFHHHHRHHGINNQPTTPTMMTRKIASFSFKKNYYSKNSIILWFPYSFLILALCAWINPYILRF